jgi:hypothetical protein
MEDKRQLALNKILELIKIPHDKYIHIDNDFNKKGQLSESGFHKIFLNENKPLEERQNFVYISGEYKLAGPNTAVYEILSKIGVTKEETEPIEINCNNFKTKKIVTKSVVQSDLSNIRNLYKKNKSNFETTQTSPTGKRISIKETLQKDIKCKTSIVCENNLEKIKDLLFSLNKLNQGLDISNYTLDSNSVTLQNLKSFVLKENTSKSKKFCIPFLNGSLVVSSKITLISFLKDINYDNVDKFVNECKISCWNKTSTIANEECKLQVTKKISYPVKDEYHNVRTQLLSPCPSP